jgi:PAS domain S-box-containing protein
MTAQKRNLLVAFTAAMCFVIILSVFSFWSIHDFIKSAESVNQTTQLTLALEKIKGTMSEVETAQRGYLLTHDSVFLRKFTKIINEYPRQIAIVKQFSKDNPEQQNSIAQVERLAIKRVEYLKKILQVDQTHNVTTDKYVTGQALMDSLRSEVKTMVIRQNNLLDQQSNEFLKKSLYAPFFLLLASLISFAIVIISYFKMNKALIREHKLKAEGIRQSYELELSKEKLKNENKFQDLVEKAPVAITIFRGKDLVVEIANKKQLQFWNKTKEETLNRPIFDHVPDELNKGLLGMLREVLSTGKPFISNEMPSTFVLNGIEQTCYVNFICEPLYKDQQIDGIIAVSTDVTEQVLARKQVEESELKFKSLIAAAPLGIGVLRGRELVFENPNQKLIDIVGKGPDITGKRLTEVMPELLESGQEYLQILDEIFTSGKTYQSLGSLVSIVENGVLKTGFYDINYVPLFNTENQVYAILDIVKDVTERVEGLKKIQESEQRFQNLVRDASVGIVVLTGEDMKVEIVNEGFSRLLNLTPADLLRQNIFEIIPDAEDYYRPILSRVMQSGTPVFLTDSPYSVVIKGEVIEGFLNVVYQPYRNSQGDIIGVIVLCNDVTQEVIAKKKSEESEQRFQAAIEAVQGVLWTNSPKGEMEGEQIGWSSLTGQTYEEYQGFGWANSVHPDDKDATLEAWKLVMQNSSIFIFEHRLKMKDGSYRNFSIRAIPLFNTDGSLRQWVGVHTDITIQKQQHVALMESESRNRSLADNTPVISFILEPGPYASVSYWNKTWLDYTGQTFEEALGRDWDSIIHPDDLQGVLKIYADAFEKLESFHLPGIRVKRHDGVYRWHLFKCNPRHLADGDFMGYIGIGFDIHDKKLAEEKLAYRTTLLEAHNQASVDGILLVDARGKILSYNERFIEIWNIPQPIVATKDDEAALTFAMSQLVNPQQFIDKVKYLYSHPTETILDDLEFKDGKIVERNGYPVIGRDGIYYAWSWTFKDVTRQKQIEKEIRDSEERFRSLAQTLPQLVWVTNAQGISEFASIRWEEYSGIEPNGELEWKAIVHPEDLDRINNAWAHSLTTGAIYKSEVRLKNKNSEYRWHGVTGEPVFDQNKKIVKWVGTFTDIQEQKLNDERKDEFVSLASHEMKTPLTTAKAYLQMLELTLDGNDEEATLFAKKANQSVDRLTELVSELLDVSKIRLGKLQYTLATFDLNELIDDTVGNIQLTTTTHKIIKKGTIYDQVYGDKNRLQQVLINLLSNAIKYSPGEKDVFITIEQRGDTIQVSVKDAGIGIAQNSLYKIFDKYHRIEEHAVHFQGLGIGLFISFEIIQRHKGKLWAESEPGKGSVFHFTLPLNNSLATKN